MKPQKFQPLKLGDTIAVIALSAPCEEQRFQRGVAYLSSLGFDVRVSLSPWASYGKDTFLFSSDQPQKRAHALTELFHDPKVRVILAARGAYGSMEVLPFISLDTLVHYPKAFVGFSDSTVFLNALYGISNMVSIHGPSLESCFSKANEDQECFASAQALIQYLSGALRNPFQDVVLEQLCGTSHEASAPLLGGNLSLLTSLMGTPWEPNFAGHILFLEESGEVPYRIHRMLLQMKIARKFDHIAGVLLGSFNGCEHKQQLGPDVRKVLVEIFSPYDVPVYGFIPAGHSALNYPVPFGMKVALANNKLELVESAVLD